MFKALAFILLVYLVAQAAGSVTLPALSMGGWSLWPPAGLENLAQGLALALVIVMVWLLAGLLFAGLLLTLALPMILLSLLFCLVFAPLLLPLILVLALISLVFQGIFAVFA